MPEVGARGSRRWRIKNKIRDVRDEMLKIQGDTSAHLRDDSKLWRTLPWLKAMQTVYLCEKSRRNRERLCKLQRKLAGTEHSDSDQSDSDYDDYKEHSAVRNRQRPWFEYVDIGNYWKRRVIFTLVTSSLYFLLVAAGYVVLVQSHVRWNSLRIEPGATVYVPFQRSWAHPCTKPYVRDSRLLGSLTGWIQQVRTYLSRQPASERLAALAGDSQASGPISLRKRNAVGRPASGSHQDSLAQVEVLCVPPGIAACRAKDVLFSETFALKGGEYLAREMYLVAGSRWEYTLKTHQLAPARVLHLTTDNYGHWLRTRQDSKQMDVGYVSETKKSWRMDAEDGGGDVVRISGARCGERGGNSKQEIGNGSGGTRNAGSAGGESTCAEGAQKFQWVVRKDGRYVMVVQPAESVMDGRGQSRENLVGAIGGISHHIYRTAHCRTQHGGACSSGGNGKERLCEDGVGRCSLSGCGGIGDGVMLNQARTECDGEEADKQETDRVTGRCTSKDSEVGTDTNSAIDRDAGSRCWSDTGVGIMMWAPQQQNENKQHPGRAAMFSPDFFWGAGGIGGGWPYATTEWWRCAGDSMIEEAWASLVGLPSLLHIGVVLFLALLLSALPPLRTTQVDTCQSDQVHTSLPDQEDYCLLSNQSQEEKWQKPYPLRGMGNVGVREVDVGEQLDWKQKQWTSKLGVGCGDVGGDQTTSGKGREAVSGKCGEAGCRQKDVCGQEEGGGGSGKGRRTSETSKGVGDKCGSVPGGEGGRKSLSLLSIMTGAHERDYAAFEKRARSKEEIRFFHVPWPDILFLKERLRLLEEEKEGAGKHKVHKEWARRWHPDKWCQYNLRVTERENILQRVTEVAKEINAVPLLVGTRADLSSGMKHSQLLRYQARSVFMRTVLQCPRG